MQDESVLAKILVGAQTQEVKVGDAIAITVEDQDAYSAFLKLDPSVYMKGKSSTPAPSSPAPPASPAPTTPAAVTKAVDHNLRISPAARHILRSHNLDAEKIKGTGKKGMILKEDVTAAIRGVSPAPSQLPPASRSEVPAQAQVSTSSSSSSSTISTPVNDRFKDIPNNNMRKVIAKRLTESKANVPHFYTSIECNVDSVLSLRKKLKKDYDLNISVNDFVIKAAALALRDVPEANARWSTALGKVIESNGVDISVAVATPNGLITPILTSADKRSLVDINKTVKDLATRARDGKLKPEEFQGGSFSISNLGNYFPTLVFQIYLTYHFFIL
jgi:pyruvate dehydrogenase E2 component (dihydrolipoamide acetyltransferase)